MRFRKTNYFGFTLIELLVAISIIGILAGLSLFGLRGSRESARDARRKADLEKIRSGLELYRADCNSYPVAPLPAVGSSLTASCPNAVTYIQEIPGDPVSGASYLYTQVGETYAICSHLEEPLPTLGLCGTCDPINCRYRVTNP
jgi:prepilin-type N-terminal cleavage/methylation domain-containing protein